MSRKKQEIYVDEEVKIGIQLAINRFLNDDTQTEIKFPSSFTSVERAFIHRKSNQHALISKSSGKGTNRYLTLRKKKSNEVLESPMIFKLGQNSKQVLQTLLHKWPMKGKEKLEIQPKSESQPYPYSSSLAYRSDANKPSGRLPNGIPQVPMKRSPSDLDSFRKTLPVYKMKEEIVKTVWDNSVILIAGETGSGKTTQIPQFILDESLRRNEVCRIVCTQPRRISAVAMAERVAIERGETVGQTVGYQIRLESRASPRTLLTFCTNGVLLRTLMSGDDVTQTMTHVIIDEVHERDRFSDFLLIKLRQLTESKKLFRLILMSASLDVNLFVNYFSQCPVVNIPGNMFDVNTLYLEDVLKCTGYLNEQLNQLKQQHDKIKQQEKSFGDWCARDDSDATPSNLALEKDDSTLDGEVEKLTLKTDAVEEWIVEEFDNSIFKAWHRNDSSAFDQIHHLIASENAPVDHRHSLTGITGLMVAAARGHMDHVEWLLSAGANINLQAPNQMTARDFALHSGHNDVAELLLVQQNTSPEHKPGNVVQETEENKELLALYHQSFDDEHVDYDLILCILQNLCGTPDNGAILVFLPGYDDIVNLRDMIVECVELSSHSDIRLYTLHSSMQTSGGQTQVFKPTPKGTRKIILSTNIAESAITIDDVVYVIDSGKVKLKMFDSITSTSSLKSVWISQSSAIQRKGRAGRCRPGTCFHLFSSSRFTAMPMFQVPELLRMPLHELCLHVKLLDTGWAKHSDNPSIESFLSYAPSPPSTAMIRNAVGLLKTIDALDPMENLTELGQHLVDLPVEPRLAKMILYGVVLKCLDPILTIACSLAYKDPFQLPQNPRMRRQALENRIKLSAGTFSDHMCLLRVFQAWQKAKSDGWEQAFCRKNFLSQASMEMIVGMRSQLLGQLRATGFVRARGGNDIRDLNTCSENWAVVKAAICASMYPNILRYDKKFGTLCSYNLKKVRFHNSSVLGNLSQRQKTTQFQGSQQLPTSWVVYDEMTRSSTSFNSISSSRCCTAVSPACVALFTGPASVFETDAIINPEPTGMPQGYPPESDSETDDVDVGRMATLNVTDWIKLRMDPTLAHMICHLRIKWYSLFARRIRSSSKPWQQEDEAVLSTIINILSCEDQAVGLTQPSGIGQRPRPLSQDDGGKGSRFIQRTPDSSKGRKEQDSFGWRKQPKSLNFSSRSQTKYGDPRSRGSSSSPRSRGSTPVLSPPKNESSRERKEGKYFLFTFDSMSDLRRFQKENCLPGTENVKSILLKAGKGVHVFFAVAGVGCIQCCGLVFPTDEGGGRIKWLKTNPLTCLVSPSKWKEYSRAACDRMQQIEDQFARSLLQAWENQSNPSMGACAPPRGSPVASQHLRR